MSAATALDRAFEELARERAKTPTSHTVALHCNTTCRGKNTYDIKLRLVGRPNPFQIGRFYGGSEVRQLVEQMCMLLETSGYAFITYEKSGVKWEPS